MVQPGEDAVKISAFGVSYLYGLKVGQGPSVPAVYTEGDCFRYRFYLVSLLLLCSHSHNDVLSRTSAERIHGRPLLIVHKSLHRPSVLMLKGSTAGCMRGEGVH